VLRPVFERMRVEGPDFLQRNAALADEVRRTLVEIDEIETQLKKAETAIEKAQALTSKYRARLAGLCDSAAGGWKKANMKDARADAVDSDRNQRRLPREDSPATRVME